MLARRLACSLLLAIAFLFPEAAYSQEHFTVTVTRFSNPEDAVYSEPVGIDCRDLKLGPPGTCTADFLVGTSVTLTAAPRYSIFQGWGGACSGMGPCVITGTAGSTYSVTATFLPMPSIVVASKGTGNGIVTVTPPGRVCGYCTGDPVKVNPGSVVTLVASPYPGSQFTGWEGACNGSGNCVLTMDGDKSVTANFVAVTIDMQVDMAAPSVYPKIGERFIYYGKVQNVGAGTAQEVTLTDVLPPGFVLDYPADSWNYTGCSLANGTLTCPIYTDLPWGNSREYKIPVIATAAGTFVNTISVTSDLPDPHPSNNSASFTVTVVDPAKPPASSADLQLTSSSSIDQAKVGDTLAYAFTATNHGPNLANQVTLTVILEPTLLVTSFTPGQGCVLTGNTVTCSPPSGLAAGSSFSVEIGFIPTEPSSTQINGAFSIIAAVVSDLVDPEPTNNWWAPDFVVASNPQGSPDFFFGAPSPPQSISAGQNAQFLINVAGNGFSGQVSFACDSGLPIGSSCSFSRATVVAGGNPGIPIYTILTITTTGTPTSAALRTPGDSMGLLALAFPVGAILVWGVAGRRSRGRHAGTVLFGVMLLLALATLYGCGGGGSPVTSFGGSGLTPTGNYNVTVTASGGGISHSKILQLEVH